MNKSILNPSVPYFGLVDDRFSPQKMIRINGVIPDTTCSRFDINLQCGHGNTVLKNDIALQLSVRLLTENIAINSFRNGLWDEKVQRKFIIPIKRGEKFEIILLCTVDQYKVTINGQHYFDFPQRICYDQISHLSIDGDVSIAEIAYESASSDFEILSVENGVATPQFSSQSGNKYYHIYPTLSLHNLELNRQSCCEKSSFPTETIQLSCLSVLQPNPVSDDIMNSDSLPVQNCNEFLKKICVVLFTIIIIIIIVVLMLSNGRNIYFSSCHNNSYSANQSILSKCD